MKNTRRDLIDMTGQTIGRAVVLRRDHATRNIGAHWICLCECGNEFSSRGCNIRVSSARFACPTCRPRSRATSCRTCAICGANGHVRTTCPKSSMGHGRFCCPGCAGMPHRRPKTRPCECGGAYAPLPVQRIEEFTGQGFTRELE